MKGDSPLGLSHSLIGRQRRETPTVEHQHYARFATYSAVDPLHRCQGLLPPWVLHGYVPRRDAVTEIDGHIRPGMDRRCRRFVLSDARKNAA